MDNCVKLVATRQYIEQKMQELCPDIEYQLKGDCMDCTLIVFGGQDEVCEVVDVFENEVYNTEDKTLAETLVETLMAQDSFVSTAESCTGGMVASSIVDVPNASCVFKEGVVTYSNEAKIKMLDVDCWTLDNYGAVSEHTAREMANGVLKNSGADIAIATTGIAGPGGGTEFKPVGLVYIAIASKQDVEIHKMEFAGNRQQVRKQASNCAMHFAIKHIINLDE